MTPSSYVALALQTRCVAVNAEPDAPSARGAMARAIERVGVQLAASKRFIGPDVALVVLPEYLLTGFPMGETTAAWAEKAALDIDGPEYAALGRLARVNAVHLAGNAYERDPHFPGLFFQTSFVVAPSGAVVLRYRRLISLFSPSPYDVYDHYIAVYGREALFPVAQTEIGRIAAIASEEILYPEIARALALRGAEVLVHSSSEAGSPRPTPKAIARQARAIENMAYVVSANTAGMAGVDFPGASTDGGSCVVDDRGLVLAEAGPGESMVAHAEIDLAALRRRRRRPGMANVLSRQPIALWMEALNVEPVQPADGLLDTTGGLVTPEPGWRLAQQRRVIEDLIERGRIA